MMETGKINNGYIEISKIVWEKIPLTRKPTPEEMAMIKNDEMFDIEEDLIDWDKGEISSEDYSYGKIKVVFDDKVLFDRRGRND